MYFPLTAFIDIALDDGGNDAVPLGPEHAPSAMTMQAMTIDRTQSMRSTFRREELYPV
jgi:hypothetical protein